MTKVNDDMELPAFLKRTETEEQAEKRRAKYAKKDTSAGLKVKKLPEPVDPKIAKAIARDLKNDTLVVAPMRPPRQQQADAVLADALAKRDAALDKKLVRAIKRPHTMARLAHLAADLPKAAREAREDSQKSAVEQINEARAKDGLRPYTGGKSDGARARRAREKSPLIAKALKARDELTAKATSTKSVAIAKKAAKPKKSDGSINRYDWNGAEEAAKKGTLPKAPDFSAWTHRYFRELLADTEKLVKARKLKELKAMRFKRTTGSPGMVKRYRDIAITALEAK